MRDPGRPAWMKDSADDRMRRWKSVASDCRREQRLEFELADRLRRPCYGSSGSRIELYRHDGVGTVVARAMPGAFLGIRGARREGSLELASLPLPCRRPWAPLASSGWAKWDPSISSTPASRAASSAGAAPWPHIGDDRRRGLRRGGNGGQREPGAPAGRRAATVPATYCRSRGTGPQARPSAATAERPARFERDERVAAISRVPSKVGLREPRSRSVATVAS